MFSFAYPHLLWLLLIVPAIGLLYAWARMTRAKKLRRFGMPSVLKPLMPLASPYKPPLKIALELLALTCVIISLCRPWGGVKDEKMTKEGIEVVLAVDASNSMLASSTADENGASRMRTAKLMLEKIIGSLDNDRVGLIIYAGDAYTLIPVTTDYVSAKMFLNSIDPAQISNQGTDIAAAIKMASRSFTDDKNIGKAIILITDAEELQNSDNVMDAAREAARQHIQLDVVGVGSSTPVPLKLPGGRYMIDDSTGEPVRTALNEDLAASIAKAGDGIYVNASNAGAVRELEKQLDTVKKTALETSVYALHDELFPVFIWIALFLIILNIGVLDRKIGWLSKISFFSKESKKSAVGLIALLIVFSSCSPEQRAAREERKCIKAGNELYESGRYDEASEKYKEALEINPNSMEALYNLSLAGLKRSGSVESDSLKNRLMTEALQGFSAVAQSSDTDPEIAGKAVYNLGNMSFDEKKFPDAIRNYKQALRFNPADNDARRNLRIAQLQKNDDQDQQNQNQDQNQQDQQQEEQQQDQQQNKDQNQDQQDQQEQQQPQINQQSAEQILQSIDNRENQVRARMMKGNEASPSKSNNRRW